MIHHRPLLLVFLFLVGVTSFHYLIVATIGSQSTLLGGFAPIADVHEPHIQEIGEFSVSEFNKQSRVQLVFIRLISGKKQVLAGITYKLVFEAVLYEKVWAGTRQLTSFKIKA
ncbi:unnamed protein product [Spirodela intermedia]|uniref:Cystatin domain-containing protein n=1 Tax=Spirodela intermedia TaxID=51605 RepID=A0A7I8IQ98_SPIIN|nr:unnamed protein product [Spirodela intermedia]CAA6659171.1 unnamed protein product [Spirodela intermedia]